MLRFALLLILFIFIARAFWRVVDGIVEGITGRPRTPARQSRGVAMVRDPVCGTFVLPDRALSVTVGRQQLFFCSRACRDKYPGENRMSAESSLRADIVEVGRRMYARGYTASNDGNISVRLDAGRLLMTPKSVCKGFMTPDMMCITDLEGRKLQGDRDPSSETLMHLEVYRQRPDVNAVVHAHPPTATGFAVAGIPLDRAVLAEVLTTLGSVPIAEYATPSTNELPEAVRKYIKAHDGMLLANHGALTVGTDLFGAYYKMETIEHFAKISLVARMLGRENVLSREEVTRLQGLRGAYGIKAPAPICADPSTEPAAGSAALDPVLGGDDATCQVVRAPSGGGQRLVLELTRGGATPSPSPEADGEIRLTYRELSALIEEAIRSLR